VGTTNHCVHGKDAVVEEILDWRPPEYFTVNSLLPIPNAPKLRSTDELVETETGTHVTMRFERPRSAKDRAFMEAALPQFAPAVQAGIDALGPLVADEMARREADATSAIEPSVPVSAGRFLSEPVDSAAVRSS
jgi:hypothetical protein